MVSIDSPTNVREFVPEVQADIDAYIQYTREWFAGALEGDERRKNAFDSLMRDVDFSEIRSIYLQDSAKAGVEKNSVNNITSTEVFFTPAPSRDSSRAYYSTEKNIIEIAVDILDTCADELEVGKGKISEELVGAFVQLLFHELTHAYAAHIHARNVLLEKL
jgi:hypothetical protein